MWKKLYQHGDVDDDVDDDDDGYEQLVYCNNMCVLNKPEY